MIYKFDVYFIACYWFWCIFDVYYWFWWVFLCFFFFFFFFFMYGIWKIKIDAWLILVLYKVIDQRNHMTCFYSAFKCMRICITIFIESSVFFYISHWNRFPEQSLSAKEDFSETNRYTNETFIGNDETARDPEPEPEPSTSQAYVIIILKNAFCQPKLSGLFSGIFCFCFSFFTFIFVRPFSISAWCLLFALCHKSKAIKLSTNV